MTTDLTGRVVVLGLDGATWDLLTPLAERGVMPNLARAMELGRHGRLESCLPPYSSPAWMSISTGKNPGSHGIFDFWEAGAPGERRLVSSRSCEGQEAVGAGGRRRQGGARDGGARVVPAAASGARDVRLRHVHARRVSRLHVAEGAEGRAEGAARRLRADPYADGLQGGAFIEQTHQVIRQQEVATRHMLDRGDWSLLFSVIQAPDPIQHKFWNVLDPTDPRYDEAKASAHLPALEESYRRCDEVIGDRLAMAERGAFVMVVSDHGFGRYEKNFYLNTVLEQLGCCCAQKSAKKAASRRLSTRSVIDAMPQDRRDRDRGAGAAPVPREAGAWHRLRAVGADR